MKLNKYGIKMNGLKAAAGETKALCPYGTLHIQISFDRATGDIITDWHTAGSWSEYHDTDIINVGTAKTPMTMQEIADAIKRRLDLVAVAAA